MTTIASLIRRTNAFGRTAKPQLAAFDADGALVVAYPVGTALDVAMASAAYHDSGNIDDLITLNRLEARDGNAESADFLRRYGL